MPLVGLGPLIFIQAYRKKVANLLKIRPMALSRGSAGLSCSRRHGRNIRWEGGRGGVAASPERLRSGVLLKFACYVIKWEAGAEYKSAN